MYGVNNFGQAYGLPVAGFSGPGMPNESFFNAYSTAGFVGSGDITMQQFSFRVRNTTESTVRIAILGGGYHGSAATTNEVARVLSGNASVLSVYGENATTANGSITVLNSSNPMKELGLMQNTALLFGTTVQITCKNDSYLEQCQQPLLSYILNPFGANEETQGFTATSVTQVANNPRTNLTTLAATGSQQTITVIDLLPSLDTGANDFNDVTFTFTFGVISNPVAQFAKTVRDSFLRGGGAVPVPAALPIMALPASSQATPMPQPQALPASLPAGSYGPARLV